MKYLILGLVALLACSSAFLVFSNVNKSKKVSADVIRKYTEWKAHNRKLYSTPAESDFRLRVFEQKLSMVESANIEYDNFLRSRNEPALKTPMFELKPYSDLTAEEFKKKYAGLDVSKMTNTELSADIEANTADNAAPSLLGQAFSIPIRDQGECGSCWAFSTIATVEKQYWDIKKQIVSLSQQELVDCSTEDNGCDGGWPYNTYSYVKQYGISAGSSYPYTGSQSNCEREEVKRLFLGSTFAPKQLAFTLSNAQNLAIKGVIAGLSVYSTGKFSHLSGGNTVYDASASGECTKQIDHAVNLGGAGDGYVVVLNSWGQSWGDQGLKKIKPCNANSLWGTPNVITHTYGNI